MSAYIVNNDNIDTFSFDNIIVGNSISNDIISKQYLYYNHNNEAKELYIKIPKIRLVYNNFINNKFSQIRVILYPSMESINKMIKFIKKLEKYIMQLGLSTNEINKMITKTNNMNLLRMNMTDVKITSDNKDTVKLSDFKINSEIEMIIKISYVWMNKDKYGLSSILYQIKYYESPEELNYDFIDTMKVIPPPPPIISLIKPIKTSMKEEKKKEKFVPSSDDLLKALTKLKSITVSKN